MAKTKISEFNANPALNTDIDSINIAEGCAPSGINDAIRELMAQLKDWQSGTSNDPYVVGSSGSLTLNQGTANGVAYLNGSKVVTSGSALTFDGTTLKVQNNNTVSPVFQIQSYASVGTAIANITYDQGTDIYKLSNPSTYSGSGIDFGTGASSTTRYHIDTSGVHVWTVASEGMRLTSTGLGIGTSSPTDKLHVAGLARINTGTYSAGYGLTFQANSETSRTYQMGMVTGGAFAIYDSTAAAQRVVLDSSGNLGLGVTPSAWGYFKAAQVGVGSLVAPTAAANTVVYNNAYYNGSSEIYITSNAASEYQQLDGAHIWKSASSGTAGNAITFTQAMTLDASGNLGIGRTSPSAKLDVAGDAIFTRGVSYNTSVNSFIELGGTDNGYVDNGLTSTWRFFVSGNASNGQSLRFDGFIRGTGWTERARINSSGGFKQQSSGASCEDTTLGYSEFNNGEVGTTALLQRCTNASFTGTVSVIKTTRSASTGFNFISAQANSVSQFVVRGDGNVTNTNNSYGAISDAKLKENVTDATPKLEKLNQVRVVNFNLIGSEHKQIGVIAQELEQIFPSMVEEMPDRDADGNNFGTTTKSVKYSVFVPMLIKAIQEQQAIIDSLKARLDAANL